MADARRGPLDFLEGPGPDFLATPLPQLFAEAVERAALAERQLGPMVQRSLEKVFGPMEDARLRALASRIVLNTVRNDLVMLLNANGRLGEVLDLVRFRGAEWVLGEVRAGRPVLFTFVHAGPRAITSGALSRLAIDTTALRQDAGIDRVLPHLDPWTASPGSMEGQMFLKHAVGRYREGWCVLMAADGKLGEGQLRHPCLGRQFPWAKGLFTLQKMTGAAVVPIVPRWTEAGGLECAFGEPLCLGGGEALELSRLAAWAEATLRTDPGQIRLRHLAEYVKAEPVPGPVAAGAPEADRAVRVSVRGFGADLD